MELIDDSGKLFGLVNVVDALVLLFVLAVLVAGVALVDPFSPSEQADRHATLDLGAHQPHIAELVSAGDSIEVGDRNLTVQDVHYAPLTNGSTHVYVRAKVPGRLVEYRDTGNRIFEYDGSPLRSGDSIELDTEEYTLSGSVITLDQQGRELSVNQTPVLVETVATRTTAETVRTGDQYQVAGQTVGTVETIRRYPRANPEQRRLLVGLSLHTIDIGNGPQFGGSVVRSGQTVPFTTDAYNLTGPVVDRGSVEPRGEPTTVGATIELRNVDPSIADAIAVDATERIDGTELARVTNVSVEPATHIVESDDGQVYGRDHPRLKDVELDVTLQVRQYKKELLFHGQLLREDRGITLDLSTLTVRGRVTDLDR